MAVYDNLKGTTYTSFGIGAIAKQANFNASALTTNRTVTIPDVNITLAGFTSGLASAIPSASTNTGNYYYATDTIALYFSNGSTWTKVNSGSGGGSGSFDNINLWRSLR